MMFFASEEKKETAPAAEPVTSMDGETKMEGDFGSGLGTGLGIAVGIVAGAWVLGKLMSK